MASLTEENVESFGTDVQKVLNSELWSSLTQYPAPLCSGHSSANKLMALPGSQGPVWPVLSCLLAEGVKRKDGAEKIIVVAFRKLAGEQ